MFHLLFYGGLFLNVYKFLVKIKGTLLKKNGFDVEFRGKLLLNTIEK